MTIRLLSLLPCTLALLAAVMVGSITEHAGAGGAIVYVDDDAPGANDGTSWEDAYRSLRAAFEKASDGAEIWVAGGTYKPAAALSDRTGTFRPRAGLEVYGGFAGTETSLDERVLGQSPTSILSGAVGTFTATDNSYHVVTIPAHEDFVFDGFTITGGYANGGGANSRGAGIYFEGDAPDAELSHLVVASNVAIAEGGGAYAPGDAVFVDVRFTENEAKSGAGAYASGGNPQFHRVTFDGNEATDTAGGLTVTGDALALILNATFRYNTADFGSAIDVTGSAEARITNTSIANNTYHQLLSSAVRIAGTGVAKARIRNTIAWGSGTDIRITSADDEVTVTDSIVGSDCPALALCLNVRTLSPGFSPLLQDNGGFVPTLGLLPESNAVDAGNNAHCQNTDARGADRPFDGDGDGDAVCDLGAFEYVTAPIVGFTVASAQQQESNAASAASLTLSHPYPMPISVEFETHDDTAVSPNDYNHQLGFVTIPPNSPGAAIPTKVINDALDEPDEKFSIMLGNLENATLGPIAMHTRTILDDDAPPTVSFAAPKSNGFEPQPGSVEVVLSAPSGKTVNVDYELTGGTAAGDIDYSLTPGTLAFTAGTTSRSFVLGVVNDGTPEPTETIRIRLSGPVNATIAAPGQHVYRIRNDDRRRTCFGKKVTIYGTDADDAIAGTKDGDVIFGGKGRDVIRGLGGGDTICGAGGRDRLRGGPGDDVIRGGFGGDRLFGGPGNDVLLGEGGPDTLRGEGGNDALSGGPKRPDVCDGGAGVDTLLANHACERVSRVP